MRHPLTSLFLLLLSGALTLFLWAQLPERHAPAAQSYGEAKVGGTFILTDTRGRTVKDSDFRGRPMLVYMGYGHCPDICPMTLAHMGETLALLGPDADRIAAIFISLDPERDTPQALGRYLASFDRRIIGLTGSKEAVAQAASAYKAYYSKVNMPNNPNYLIDHSGFLYLMDGTGKYVAHFESDTKPNVLAGAIKNLLSRAGL